MTKQAVQINGLISQEKVTDDNWQISSSRLISQIKVPTGEFIRDGEIWKYDLNVSRKCADFVIARVVKLHTDITVEYDPEIKVVWLVGKVTTPMSVCLANFIQGFTVAESIK